MRRRFLGRVTSSTLNSHLSANLTQYEMYFPSQKVVCCDSNPPFTEFTRVNSTEPDDLDPRPDDIRRLQLLARVNKARPRQDSPFLQWHTPSDMYSPPELPGSHWHPPPSTP